MTKSHKIFGGVCAFTLLVAPAFADNVLHLWECEIEKDASLEQLIDVSKQWTAAVQSIDGAGEIVAYLDIPIAGDAESGEFMFVMVAPSAAAWAAYMDGYGGSEAEALEEEWDKVASCSESSMWESIALQ